MKEKYDVKLEGKEWKDCLKHAFDKKKKDIKMDGFRKGQVPYDVYVKKMGVEALYMDAVDIAVDVLYAKLLKDEKTIIPVATPGIDIKNINHDEIEIEFTLVSAPKVELGKHTKLGIKKEEVVVTDSQIEHELHHLQEQFVEVKELDDDAVIKEGNVAVIDFEGFKEGKAFKGGKGEDYSLEIGSHTFIPGFEEALVGLKKGDTKDVNVTFPENYHSEDLKGQPVIFKVTVKAVKERVLPEFNKEFFEDLNVGGVESLEDLKKYIKENMTAERSKQIEDEYLFKCLDEVVKNSKFDIPEEMTEDETNRLVREFSEKLSYQGLKLEDYLKYINSNINDFKATLKDDANKRVGYRLIMDAIIENEKIEVSDEELESELKKTSEQYKMSVEDFLKEIGNKELFKYDLLMRKAMEIVTK
ncbi:trigger factor [Clostridium sp. CAG:1000]|jgi:trigger factor|nr:trigger factor [Clostridium sp. CAG:1000]